MIIKFIILFTILYQYSIILLILYYNFFKIKIKNQLYIIIFYLNLLIYYNNSKWIEKLNCLILLSIVYLYKIKKIKDYFL